MPSRYYLGDRPDDTGTVPRRILMFTYMGILVAAVIAFSMIYTYNDHLTSVMPSFESAIQNRRYSEAIEIYRKVQSDVLLKDPADTTSSEKEQFVLEAMENIVFTRCDVVLNSIREERYSPNADDLAFLEEMGELTGARLSVWLNLACEDFLLGKLERPTLQFILDQISDLSNVAAAVNPLLSEIDSIEQARGDVLVAEDYFSSKSYILAVEKFENIIEYSKGFVNTYAQKRLQTCESEMYEPIMAECDHLLKTFRYYTAEEILSDMARIFPDDPKVETKLLEATSNTSLVVEYQGVVEVICVKPLIADTSIAFTGTAAATADSLKLTTTEFQKILEQLYANNYILIDVRSMTDRTNLSTVEEETLRLPEGKKPIVIILEDVNYSAYQRGTGTCNRLVLDENGAVAGEFIDASGRTIVGRDAEAIGILDSFVEQHPDFSFDGAKGIVSFSGYETTMGYITDMDQVDDRNAALSAMNLPTIMPASDEIDRNRETVQQILATLKDTGWIFASSTYGFINANSNDMTAIENDTQKWMTQIGSLLGPVEILVYPNGDFIKGSDARCVYLKDNGFRIFFGVGPLAYYTYGANYLYLDRAMLNGDTLRSIDYSRLFDVASVYDTRRPTTL